MKLGELCILFTDGDWIESKDQSDSGIRLIQTGNIGNGEFLYKNDKAKYISVDTFKRLNCKEVFPNDILVSRLPEPVGRGCIIPDIGEKMITAVDCTICRINENLVDKKYFCYFLESNAYKTQLEQHVTGTTRKRISRKNLSSVEIDIPEQAKQKEVVYKLDRLKKIIQNYNRELDLLDELVRARFVEMFGEYEASVKLSRYIKELRAGKSLAGKTKCKNKVLKTGAATFGFFDKEQYKYYPAEYVPNPLHKVEDGDVIISRMNTPELVGSCSYVFEAPDDMYYPDRLWKTIITEDTNPIFLWQLMWQQDIRKQIKENSFGTSGTMNNISKVKLLNIKAIDVPLELQNQFASFVEEIDKSRLLSNHSLFLLKSMIF